MNAASRHWHKVDALAGRAWNRRSRHRVAGVFTTQTFSHVITRMRDAIQRAPAPRLNFDVGPDVRSPLPEDLFYLPRSR